jgi:hypothetical protein
VIIGDNHLMVNQTESVMYGRETERLAFLEQRDGRAGAQKFAAATLDIYRKAVLKSAKRGVEKPHYASTPQFRRGVHRELPRVQIIPEEHAMKRDWRYVHTSNHTIGTMVCCSCNKLITDGDFRYRDNGNGFTVQCRPCSKDADQWKRVDHDRAASRQADRALLKEARQFKAKWGIFDLDDLIEQLSSNTAEDDNR